MQGDIVLFISGCFAGARDIGRATMLYPTVALRLMAYQFFYGNRRKHAIAQSDYSSAIPQDEVPCPLDAISPAIR